jgi:hypothetical protein
MITGISLVRLVRGYWIMRGIRGAAPSAATWRLRGAAPCAAVLLCGIAICGSAHGQSMVETAAAAAGGSVGGVAGKKVSDGLSAIFEKVDKSTAKAAKGNSPAKGAASPARTGGNAGTGGESNTPLLEVGPGVPRPDGSNVPPPPPLRRASVRRAAPTQDLPPPIVPPPAPMAPAPQMTADDLKQVTSGMQRNEVLKLGEPTSRISMVDEGHLLEIYRYQSKDSTLGVVHLTDGAVSTVLIR